jgi:hypothetical protein
MRDRLFIIVGAIISVVLLPFLLILDHIKTIEILTSFILFLTFLAILWYSKETQELKEAAIKNPCVTLYKKNGVIKIKNYGTGVARNITFVAPLTFTFPLLSSNGFEDLSDNIVSAINGITDTITIEYYDLNKVYKYTTKLKWDSNNQDGVQIEKYERKNATAEERISFDGTG